MKGLFRNVLPALVLMLWVPTATAETFTVSDIEVEGLQRVSAGRVFGALPVEIGDRVDQALVSDSIRTLFRTGLFADVVLYRDAGVLIVEVQERPSISGIEVEGNDNIETEQLMEGMRQAGVEEGQIFQRATVERLELEILRSYVAQGRYNASVNAKVNELPRNRVGIKFSINEGSVAAIHRINIIGNEAYTDAELIGMMELRETSLWNSITNADKYARERFSGDLETLRSHYLNNGYVDFSVETTNISLAPDKKKVFVIVAMDEGPRYRVRDVKLEGKLIVPGEELRKLIVLEQGQTFSQQRMTLSSDRITRRLGREGYSFANVEAIPETHEDGTTTVVFNVQPGKRTYVRRIEFRGNNTTHDEVLRQEMRQMEGGVASSSRIEASRTELQRTGFFENVTVDTSPVTGTNDQVDVTYTVKEQPTGSVSANLGFSQASGLIFGGSISERNFFGSGRSATISVNSSQFRQSARISYRNPFYTVDGVSRSFSLRVRETDFDEEDISSFVLDQASADMTFGYPISNNTRLSFGPGFEHSSLQSGSFSALEIQRFVEDEGRNLNAFLLNTSIVRNTHNRGRMPTAGLRTGLDIETAVPGSDLSYVRMSQNTDAYFPIDSNHRWVGRFRSTLGYGESFGNTSTFPFFKHFFAGGFGSIRGFDANSLGREETLSEDTFFSDADAFGGDVLVETSAELIVPIPFAPDSRSMRGSFFFDAGNVFDTERGFDPAIDEIRTSVGVSFQWFSALGPLGFSLAEPINSKSGDDIQRFQFSLGQQF